MSCGLIDKNEWHYSWGFKNLLSSWVSFIWHTKLCYIMTVKLLPRRNNTGNRAQQSIIGKFDLLLVELGWLWEFFYWGSNQERNWDRSTFNLNFGWRLAGIKLALPFRGVLLILLRFISPKSFLTRKCFIRVHCRYCIYCHCSGVCSYGLADCQNWAPEVYTKV